VQNPVTGYTLKTNTRPDTIAGRVKYHLRRDMLLYLMITPVLVWYMLFVYKPMYGLVVAFQDYSLWKGIRGSEWVGFDNFIAFFNSPFFFRTFKNTVMFNFYKLLFDFPAPIILALLLNEVRKMWFKRAVQTMTYLPYFISVVVVAGIVTNFLAPTNGLINIILDMLGFNKVYFLTIPEYFRAIYILAFDIWKDIGFGAIIYIAALAGINPELYEAAGMDGASRFRKIWHISLPGILPTILILFLLRISNFIEMGHEAIILLYQPITYETADILSTYAYRVGIVSGNYDLGAAVGLFTNTVGLILVIIFNRISNRLTGGGLW
jgi:putative aldouronate transport system permease protein